MIPSGTISLPRLSEATGLLADSGCITSYDLWSTEGLSAILCLPSIGLKLKVPKSLNLKCFPGHIFLEVFSWPYPPGSVFLAISSWKCLLSHIFLGVSSWPYFPGGVFLAISPLKCISGHILLDVFSWSYIPGSVFLTIYS